MKRKPTKKKKVMTKALKVRGKTPPLALQAVTSIEGLIALALREKASMEQVDKFMQMKYRHEEREARKEYFRALSRFQGSIGPMCKKKEVAYGNTSYWYATLGQIESQIKVPLADNDLTKRFEIEDAEKIKVTCITTHIGGHSERTSMSAAPDTSGGKNTIQARASTVTYMMRYTLIGALGLATADEDNDGRTPKQTTAPPSKKPPVHTPKQDAVLPPVKPTSKRDAILSTLKGSWNALRTKDKKKYDDKYYSQALGFSGCEKTADCTDAQLIELTKELDIERRNANG